MNHKMTVIGIAFFLLGLVELYAQESPISSGGEAIGTGGTVSYSVGQVVYTTDTGTGGSVAQGVQQTYSISTTWINESSISMTLSVYPNPTTDFLTLKIEDVELSILNFQLFDMQGKLLESKKVASTSFTKISLENQPNATYFLNVTKNNSTVKTFKIIKQK